MTKKALTAAALLLAVAIAAPAQDARAIVEEADSAMIGERVYSVSEMTVYRSEKPQPSMRVESYSLKEGDRDQSLTIYRSPARMKGTAYLLIDDDLWVRFSATGRIRKLSSSARKNSAGGSDFSYNDMVSENEGMSADYDVELIRSGVPVEGIPCHEILFTAKPDRNTPYEKAVAFIRQADRSYFLIDFYEQNANTKTLRLSDYRNVDGRLYPFRMEMASHVKPTRTVVVIEEVEFGSLRVESRQFSQTYLQEIQ